jgi:broad specificity phosphatase PhoE
METYFPLLGCIFFSTYKEESNITKTMSDISGCAVLIVARHGERLDSVTKENGGNWLIGQERPFDPPLTSHGKDQAKELGRELMDKIKTLELPPISNIYTSPLLRCRQTAAAMRKAMINEEGTLPQSSRPGFYEFLPLARLEPGLSESINESWYRSWSLPGADGTWGFGSRNRIEIDPESLHSLAKRPVQPLLRLDSRHDFEDTNIDPDYLSRTAITAPYCFYPMLLESKQDQRDRMRQTVKTLQEPGRTTICVSHGGPITHLYEDLIGNNWQVHGESTYCCYSIYRQAPPSTSVENGSDNWEALVVNESKFLREQLATERHI